jgi:hypothetical protein
MLTDRKLFLQFERSAVYKMEINVSGQQRIFLFRGPGCRTAMLEWWRDHLRRAKAGEDIRNIRVWGTVGNKTDIVLEWPRAMASRTGRARSQQRPRNERRPGR